MISLMPVTFGEAEISALHGVFASNADYWRYSGDLDPDAVTREAVAEMVRAEADVDGHEALAARDEHGVLVGYVELLLHHPRDGYPWIGFLLVHGGHRRRGLGRAIVSAVEARLRERGATAVGLGVLENNPEAFAFWTALGHTEVGRRPDVAKGRPTVVMRKALR
ncbi:GNAT family N-acetyltransferase [Actinomadura harenae]|uniref:GNAT family N-acetyltransferase n=1 Tax=Actinomadura harenae TaxID=2483351 RepID=A0A3M2LSA7_9ACTN|nr:GNAT family N-acetyltransferase [Actinomadura harenae]RMI40364.1 GNAT family N-acetyltransferase [Actinomadura harenae]